MITQVKHTLFFKFIALLIVCVFLSSLVMPTEGYCAAARTYNGGKLAKFDTGKFAASVGIGLVSMGIGGALSSGLSSAMKGADAAGSLAAMGNSLSRSMTFAGLATNYSTFVAVSQVGRAVGYAGAYHGWSPKTTYIATIVASSAVGGFLNPSAALGEGMINSDSVLRVDPSNAARLAVVSTSPSVMLKGALVGGLTGLASSSVIAAVDSKSIKQGKEPGVGAQIAGMITGVAAGNFGRELVNPTAAGNAYAKIYDPHEATYEEYANGDVQPVYGPVSKSGYEQKIAEAQTPDAASTYQISDYFGYSDIPSTPGAPPQATPYQEYVKSGNYVYGPVSEVGYNQKVAEAQAARANYYPLSDYFNYGYMPSAPPQSSLSQVALSQISVPQVTSLQSSLPRVQYRYYEIQHTTPQYGVPRQVSDFKEPPSGVEVREVSGPALRELQTKMALGSGYDAIGLTSDTVYLLSPQGKLSGDGLLTATFVKTADMWPQLVSRSLSIAATSSSDGKNSWKNPLISAAIEGVAGPLLSNAAEYFALKPGLYIGTEQVKNSIIYNQNMLLAANNYIDNKFGEACLAQTDNKDIKVEDLKVKLESEYNNLAKNLRVSTEGIQLTFPPDLTNTDQWKETRQKDIIDTARNERWTEEKTQMALDDLNQMALDRDPRRLLLGAYHNAGQQLIRQRIMEAPDLDTAFANLGTSRFNLFLQSTAKDMTYGLVEGLVSGGFSALSSKLAKDKNGYSAEGALIMYGAALASGALRGVIWHKAWEEPKDSNDRQVWGDRWAFYKPEPYKGDDWWQAKIAERAYAEEMGRFDKFARVTALPLETQSRKTVNINSAGEIETISKPTQGYNIGFKNKQPTLDQAVLASLVQTNHEFQNRAFSFGAPVIDPQYINAMHSYDYFQQLTSYGFAASSPGWFSRGVNSGFQSAGAIALRSGAMGMMAAMRPTANLFNMQNQRLVITNAPRVPITIQSLDYRPWALGTETIFYAPFPTDNYITRNRSGKTFLRDER